MRMMWLIPSSSRQAPRELRARGELCRGLPWARWTVLAPHLPQRVADFAQGHVGFDGLDEEAHQVVVGLGRQAQTAEHTRRPGGVAPGAQGLEPAALIGLDAPVD